jgi:uncharacterized protein YeaO (DUF488 family)
MVMLSDSLSTAEPPAVTLEKCPGLYEWANSDADESYAPIHSLQHWRCNDASESVPFTDTYRHEVKLNSSQLEAVKSAIKHRFSLIHGVSSRQYCRKQVTCTYYVMTSIASWNRKDNGKLKVCIASIKLIFCNRSRQSLC